MPRAVSTEKIGDYFRLRLEGHSNIQASERVGFSSRTGTNHLNRVKDEARRSGLVSVARSYGLDIEGLVKLGGDLRKNGLRVEDSKVGLYIASVLTNLGIDLTRFETFVEEVFVDAENQGIPYDELSVALNEFSILRREYGLSYRQANEKYQELFAHNKRLGVENLDLQKQIKSLKHQLNEEMRAGKVTREELKNFTDARDALSKLEISFDDYDKLPSLFQNLKNLDYEPKAVANMFSAYKDLTKQRRELSGRNKGLADENVKLAEEKDKLKESVKERQSFVESLRLLKSQDLQPENMRALTEAIASIGTKHGLTSSESMIRFCEEVKGHFYPLLSLGDEETRRKNRVDSLNLKINQLQRDIEIQSEVYESRREILDALKKLNETGVSDNKLIIWNLILQKLDIDPTELRLSIEQMGSLESIVISKSGELKELEDKIAQLSRVHDQLESNLKSLTSNTVKEVEETLGRFTKILDAFDEQFLSEETGFNAESKRILNNSLNQVSRMLRTTEASWDKKLKDLSKQLGNVVQEVEETRDIAYETGKEVGQYSTINVLSKILRGESIERNEAIANMIIFTNGMENWALNNNQNDLRIACSKLRSDLTKMMRSV